MAYVTQLANPVGFRCHWCARLMSGNVAENDGLVATKDHINPKRDRESIGTKKAKRQVWAYRACNEIKADMLLPNWKVFMAAHPKWWELWRSDFFAGRKRMQKQQRHFQQKFEISGRS